MNIQFDKVKANISIDATITKEEDFVKSKISYDNSTYKYDLLFLTSEETSAIYYNHKQQELDNKLLEIYNNEGNLVYTSYRYNNGLFEASGWLVDYITNYDKVEKINDNYYLVDEKPFLYTEGKSNIHEIKLNSLIDLKHLEKTNNLLLGKLDYQEDVTKIIPLRAPFMSNYYDQVVYIAQNVKDENLEVSTQ